MLLLKCKHLVKCLYLCLEKMLDRVYNVFPLFQPKGG